MGHFTVGRVIKGTVTILSCIGAEIKTLLQDSLQILHFCLIQDLERILVGQHLYQMETIDNEAKHICHCLHCP